MTRKIANYGWIRDLPDHRDFLYAAPAHVQRNLPQSVDLRAKGPAGIYDQGDLGSCTGNAIAAAIEYDQIRQGLPRATPSRLFIYYNERSVEGNVETDSGAQIRDGIKVVASIGACMEDLWPYNIASFTKKPNAAAYQCAAQHKIVLYRRLTQGLDDMKSSLASGIPFVFGFSVYESFESDRVAKTGILYLPQEHESLVGGHAVLAVGYDDRQKRFLVRNSWGADWGQNGHFTIPYEYLENSDLASDFWNIQSVEE